ncbi:MAG: hypothetical protein DRI90_22455 [Deltaproteobacteria bacterium]|nr:MAG: hypothetical protein DRI90_22455 [Deltaproteobacteria bacterium]
MDDRFSLSLREPTLGSRREPMGAMALVPSIMSALAIDRHGHLAVLDRELARPGQVKPGGSEDKRPHQVGAPNGRIDVD